MIIWVLTAHIVVLGYWLGSELVINSTYRYVCYAVETSFDERSRLMDHVMKVDQHVRYALVLQTVLGLILAVSYGWLPGGEAGSIVLMVFGVLWLGFVEAVHRLRQHRIGSVLATIDRVSRYVLMAMLVMLAIGWLADEAMLPTWLRWKLAAFAGVIACGVGIRIALIGHFRTWSEMASDGVTMARNAAVQTTYRRATGVLLGLWGFIAIIVWLSVAKPV